MASPLIASPWRTIFEGFISSARNDLLIAVPFYSEETVKFILTKIGKNVSTRFLLALSASAVKTGAQSTRAIRMMRKDKLCSVRFIKNLHAKILIKDRRSAVVTSSNLTSSGLNSNVEMGIMVTDVQTVGEMVAQFEKLWVQSKGISSGELNAFHRLSPSRRQVDNGESFGAAVRFGKLPPHLPRAAEHASGWILIHSPKRFGGGVTPQDELARDYKPGLLWHWNRSKPMKAGGPYTLLLAYEQRIFGEATVEITRDIKKKMRPDFNFAFKLHNYKQLNAEVPFSELHLGNRAHSHRDLIRLDDTVRIAYDRAKRNAGDD